MPPVAVLVGAPGSGKTTVGQALAQALGVPFRDTDDDVAALAGMPVGDIFIQHGEPHFRDLEAQAVARAIAEFDGVLAVGGGAVERSAKALARLPVVWLTVPPAQAVSRIGLSGPRPVLLGNVRGRWADLMSQREPGYESTCRWRVSTADRPVAEIVTEIVECLAGAEND